MSILVFLLVINENVFWFVGVPWVRLFVGCALLGGRSKSCLSFLQTPFCLPLLSPTLYLWWNSTTLPAFRLGMPTSELKLKPSQLQ